MTARRKTPVLHATSRVLRVLVVVCGLAVLGAVVVDAGRAAFAPPLPPAPAPPAATQDADATAAALTTQLAQDRVELDAYGKQLATYEKELDTLNKLAAVLIGLGALYAIVLGVAQYQTLKDNIERADKAIDDARERSERSAEEVKAVYTDLQKSYPMMRGLGQALDDIVSEQERLLVTTEVLEIAETYESLAAEARFRFVSTENLLPLYDHFTGTETRLSEMFRGVGRFYMAKYAWMKRTPPAPSPKESPELMRARYYLERALRFNAHNYACLNDLGWVSDELGNVRDAECHYQLSYELQKNQQRAQYNLAILVGANDLTRAVALLTQAIAEKNWERHPSGTRVRDLHYNRACYYSLLGAKTTDLRCADLALADLREGCKEPNEETKRIFPGDLQGDLKWLRGQRPKEVAEIETQVTG